MKYFFSVFTIFFFASPLVVLAGSQTYSSSGTYTFTVPSYGSLTVTVNGAGGGGGGGAGSTFLGGDPTQDTNYDHPAGSAGSAGNASSFNAAIFGNGGGGGTGGWSGCSGCVTFGGGNPTAGYGVSGSASGGTTNTSGGGAAGGLGGLSGPYSWYLHVYGNYSYCGGSADGCPGGAGGQSVKTYSSGQLTPGSTITVVVGSGGSGGAGAGTYDVGDPGGGGSGGSVSISWTTPSPASCSVSLTPSTINQGQSSTLSWSSTNADTSVYINNVGYVLTSGTASVAPGTTKDYSCEAQGAGGTDGWHSAILTVHASCTFNAQTVTHGSSVTAYASSSVPFGNSCISQTRICSDGSLSGTYQYSTCAVQSPGSCTLDGVTVAHNATSTFYSTTTAPSGSLCSSISQARGCYNATLNGSALNRYASCSCTLSNSCISTSTVQTINPSCAVTTTSCTNGTFCSAGMCISPAITSNSTSTSRLLDARPTLVRQGSSTRLYWDINNASCIVDGSNNDHWTGATSGSGGVASRPLQQNTSFTIVCTGLDNSTVRESIDVNIVPVFQEK